MASDVQAGFYQATVQRAGWYNVDKVIQVTITTGQIKNGTVPVSHAIVKIEGENYNAYTFDYTDSNGYYSVPYKSQPDA